MALQGTLDTFALPDVLHLLATTKKTGQLRLEGQRGSGTVHLDGGQVVGVEAAHAPLATEPVDALFELIRFEDGTFAFAADAAPAASGPARDVGELLEGAEALLREWREIESVVPSLDAYVTLRRSLPAEAVTIPQAQWSTLVAVAGGTTVRALGQALSLPELPVSRAVRDLVELGVVELEDRAPAGPATAPANGSDHAAPPAVGVDLTQPVAAPAPASEVSPPPPPPAPVEAEPEAEVPAAQASAPDGELPVARPIRAHRPRPRVAEASDEPERFIPLDLPGHEPSPAVAAAETEDLDDLAAAFPGLASRSLSEEEGAAVSEQLAQLSPEAADAVLAAVDAPDEEAREAALDEAVAGEDAPINRGLLLKFLGSAKS